MAASPATTTAAIPEFLRGLVRLHVDNFTPLRRTPWAGEVIARALKDRVVPPAPGERIGESWEFSADPAMPSKLVGLPAEAGKTLLDLVTRFPHAVLGPNTPGRVPRLDILVKLVDAAKPLSLQAHPADDDPDLATGECGKPESWLILSAAEGAGIYVGFSRATTMEELREAFTNQANDARAKALMFFVPVVPGDYFEIGPGVPHAIGSGVTLLEPQRVIPGLAGKTFRVWDWGRRYDPLGQEDAKGKARELHVEQSLKLFSPDVQVGTAFVKTLRREPKLFHHAGAVSVLAFPANAHYQTLVTRAGRPGTLELTSLSPDGYGALVILNGELEAKGQRLKKGEPALLPWAALPLKMELEADTEFALIIPAGSTLGVR